MTTLSPAERVAAGAAWLDEHGPVDWRSRISLPDFDVMSTCRCVLGQLYAKEEDWPWTVHSGFTYFAIELLPRLEPEYDTNTDWLEAHGFDYDGDGADAYSDYEALQAEWVKVLTPREVTA